MSEGLPKFEAIAMGTEVQRVEALREFLGYPLQELDRTGSGLRYVRAGQDVVQAKNTCPIAVGFYEELDRLSDAEIKDFLVDKPQQQKIYGHYQNQEPENTPVMYLLLPVAERVGRVAIVLPAEGKLRKSQIQIFAWDSDDLKARLGRLQWGTMQWANKITETALLFLPNVDWVFYKPIETAKELAIQLALVTRQIEQAISDVFAKKQANDYLQRLLESFKRELLPSLKPFAENEKDYSFADIYAQTIAYGLFTARVFRQVRDRKEQKTIPTYFTRQDAWDCLPETNPFLRQLFKDVSEHSLDEFGDELSDGILEIFGILRAAKMDAILSDFEQKMNREDIVIRFYEDFLAAYKPKMRERRGVYYTPEPVVSYMVRSVDILIKEKFNKPLGLADPEVMILDPACGTGTFLLWIFKLIHDRFENDGEARSLIKQKLGDISWSDYVRDHLLPRVFGFELLMAPYAICHLKLGLFLEESGYRFDSSQRLGVYLTNTLDDAKRRSETLFKEFIAEESNEAAGVKLDIPVMVVIGNPPYSGHSENKSEWVGALVKDYYFVDGLPLGEKNPKWLQDDYVKFIRFSQWRIDKTGTGILAFVTNHGYLDNPTFRGMRQSLAKSFNWIRILDLHGNSKKKETAVDGTKDENVFDIQQGVAVCIMIKEQGA
ncbi:MAG: N-6 DNA methylase [Pseudanabaena sp.]|jgi:type I restriction-modification system DNA methylase subunit